jgi:hypothetical protein
VKATKIGSGMLALWLAVAPGFAAGIEASDLFARYSRGELSLHEYEEAKRSLTPPPEPAVRGAEVPSESAARETDAPTKEGSTLGRIATWVKDIPKRTVRRWAPDDTGFETAEQATDHIENAPVPAYTANAAQREAESDWTRPLKVTARGEADTIQTVIERVVGVGGLAALAKALSGDQNAQRAVQTAQKVVARMNPAEKTRLLAGLKNSAITQQVAKMIGGKPTSRFGKIIKDGFGNNMILAVAASGVVSHFLNDGLDLDTLKDHLVALNAVEGRRTWREDLIGVPAETVALYHMVNASGRAYEAIWNKVATGSGGLAAWVQRAEGALGRFGQSIVKRPPPQLAAKAAELGRTAQSLGLPGVTGATALTFKGLVEAGFSGVTIGMLGIPLINGGWKVILGQAEGQYIGGDRNRIFARYDLADTYFQRTGNTLKDAVEERVVATKNFVEAHEKFPATHFLSYFLRVSMGYIGAVTASAMVAPVGIPSFAAALIVSAVFSEGGRALGNWLGAKLDTRGGRYAKQRQQNAGKSFEAAIAQGAPSPERDATIQAMAALDRARLKHGIRTREDTARVMSAGGEAARDLERAARAYQRAKAAYRRGMAETASVVATHAEKLMKASQVQKNIRFVGDLADIRLVREDGYVWVITPDGWKVHASPRYDFVDAAGRRGVWDPKTNRIIDVGLLAATNGNRIAFVDEIGVKVVDGKIQAPDDPESADGNVVITKNGVILERGRDEDPDKTEWKVRGYGGEYDVVLRDSGRRFIWDGEAYKEIAPVAKTAEAEKPEAKVVARIMGAAAKELAGQAAVDVALADLGRVAKAGRSLASISAAMKRP